MGYTFNAFVKFISDDPIMLGLCIAIVVLVILFIVVLFLGKRSDKKEKENIDNKDNLLKTEINMEPLKDTEQFSLDLQEDNKDSIETTIEPETLDTAVENLDLKEMPEQVLTLEDVELPNFEDIKEIPVVIEEKPIPIEFNLEVENAPKLESENDSIDNLTVAEPAIPASFEDFNIKTDPNMENKISLENVSTENVDNENLSIIESAVTPVEENIFDIPQTDVKEKRILETVEPQVNNIESSMDIEMPLMTDSVKDEEPSVYENILADLPEIKVDAFDKTAILKTIPNMMPVEEPAIDNPPKEKEVKESFDELDLPKLNTNNTKSVLNSIKGESFDI
ncbi:MAG: hypothetical protein HFG33_01415 [Bacilli bacterium]|nr:hypothetical protein [Bacilli bacterium]